jgi:hypothetical protein
VSDPSVERAELVRVFGRRTVQRWHYAAEHSAFDTSVSVGWINDGRWWVGDDDEPRGWVYTGEGAEQAARAQAARLLAKRREHPGEWHEVVAEHQPGVAKPEPADVPAQPPAAWRSADGSWRVVVVHRRGHLPVFRVYLGNEAIGRDCRTIEQLEQLLAEAGGPSFADLVED